jgi:hypothetical protein
MSEQFTLPPGCGGLKIDSDGTRYGADRHGRIAVDNPHHAAQIREKGSKYINKSVLGAFYGLDIERCACGFAPHKFSDTCAKCGNKLK